MEKEHQEEGAITGFCPLVVGLWKVSCRGIKVWGWMVIGPCFPQLHTLAECIRFPNFTSWTIDLAVWVVSIDFCSEEASKEYLQEVVGRRQEQNLKNFTPVSALLLCLAAPSHRLPSLTFPLTLGHQLKSCFHLPRVVSCFLVSFWTPLSSLASVVSLWLLWVEGISSTF